MGSSDSCGRAQDLIQLVKAPPAIDHIVYHFKVSEFHAFAFEVFYGCESTDKRKQKLTYRQRIIAGNSNALSIAVHCPGKYWSGKSFYQDYKYSRSLKCAYYAIFCHIFYIKIYLYPVRLAISIIINFTHLLVHLICFHENITPVLLRSSSKTIEY